MSAAEIIEQINRLPPEEKQAVIEYLTSDANSAAQSKDQTIDRRDLERTAREIFKEHEQLFRKLAQ